MEVKRTETSPLEKFKYQAALTKKFGKKSLLLYNAIPIEAFKPIEEIAREVPELSEEKIEEIIKFMESRGMITIKEIEEEKESAVEEAPAVEEQKEEVKEIKMEEEKELEIEQPKEEISIEQPENELEIEKPEEISIEREEKEVEEQPPKEEIKQESQQPEEQEEIEEQKEDQIEQGEEQEEIEIKPASLEEEQPPKEEIKQEPQEIQQEEIEIKPASFEEESNEPQQESEEQEEDVDVSSLSPLENEIFQKFGKQGVLVYRKVKEGYTEEEIYSTFGDEKENLSPIIEFLKDLGYLGEEKEEEREKFAPMADYVEEEDNLKIEKGEEIFFIKNVKESMIAKARERMLTSLKFGKEGSLVFDGVHKGVDEISLIKKSKAKISTVEKILKFLESEKYVELSSYNREEIKNKFGEDSYIVYKNYGKKGLVFYELIGEDIHLKEIATILEIEDKEKVIEIFMFIHDLLNIEVPLDRNLLLKKLE